MAIALIDTHCHLDHEWFDEDREEVIHRAIKAGIKKMIIPGLDQPTSAAAISLAQHHEAIYAAVGYHPNTLPKAPPSPAVVEDIRHWVMDAGDKVVAIGEIGLDYYWNAHFHDHQANWLRRQLDLALDLRLPVILHNRESTRDLLDILREWRAQDFPSELADRPGVFHSFSGEKDEAQEALELGFYIGISGPVTFKKADSLREIAQMVPADRLLVETDSPFLTPAPHRGQRNEPAHVRLVAQRIAEERRVSLEELAHQTSRNAETLFRFSTTA